MSFATPRSPLTQNTAVPSGSQVDELPDRKSLALPISTA